MLFFSSPQIHYPAVYSDHVWGRSCIQSLPASMHTKGKLLVSGLRPSAGRGGSIGRVHRPPHTPRYVISPQTKLCRTQRQRQASAESLPGSACAISQRLLPQSTPVLPGQMRAGRRAGKEQVLCMRRPDKIVGPQNCAPCSFTNIAHHHHCLIQHKHAFKQEFPCHPDMPSTVRRPPQGDPQINRHEGRVQGMRWR